MLARVLRDFPQIEVQKVEFLTARAEARKIGVETVPALVYGERKLTGIFLTPGKIRAFLESL